MRILIVSQYFWPETFGINEVVRSLVVKGVKVDVLTGKPNYPEGVIYQGYRFWGCQTEKVLGAMVYRIPLVARGNGSAILLFLNYLSFVFFGLLYTPWILRKQRYDVVFVYAVSPILQAIPALFIGWLRKLKVIVWVQDLWPESLEATNYIRNPRVLGFIEWIVRLIYRHSDMLLVQSNGFKSRVSSMVPDKPVVYYPNSVEDIFSDPPDVTLPVVNLLEDSFTVVFAGNVGIAQAVDVIVEAAVLLKDYSDINFVVYGQGSRWEWMREQVHSRGLSNLYLFGRFPVNAMPGLMQKASALLVTLADEPIFALTVPNKIQAYMAAGRPILACINGEGARLVSEAQAGLCVPAEDAAALAVAVLELYKMPLNVRAKLGENGRSYFKLHFDRDKLVDDLIHHLRAMSKTTVVTR